MACNRDIYKYQDTVLLSLPDNSTYCKTHYYRAPFNFTHFALGDDNVYIAGADIRSKQHNNGPSSGDPVDARN